MAQDRLAAAATGPLVFLGALVLFALDWTNGLGGGISTAGAERVARGEVPYRDFWTIYAPGHYYLLAALFRLFGFHLFVEVVAASVVSAAAAWAAYALAVRFAGRLPSVACAAVFTAAMIHTGNFERLGTYPPAVLFALTAGRLAVRYLESRRLVYAAGAGLACGLTTLFKHDVGAYTLLAILAGFAADRLLAPRDEAGLGTGWVKPLLACGTAFASLVVPVAGVFVLVAGRDMLDDLVVFPLTDFPHSRPESYPGLLPRAIYDPALVRMLHKTFRWLHLTLPFLLFVAGAAATFAALLRRRRFEAAAGTMLGVLYLLHYGAAHVQINTHLISMSVYGSCLGLLGWRVAAPSRLAARPASVAVAGALLVLGWIGSLSAKPVYAAWQLRAAGAQVLRIPRASGFRLPEVDARALENLHEFVTAQVPPEDPIFIGLHRHDVVVINDPLLYFLLERPNATRFHELHPAIADAAPAQHEIRDALVRQDVSLVILKKIFSDADLERVKAAHRANLPYIGSTILDDFLRARFKPARQFGPFEVWIRQRRE